MADFIDIDSTNESLKLNANTIDWSDYGQRVRYKDGKRIGYDRFLVGVLAGAVDKTTGEKKYPFLADYYGDSQVVHLFNLGYKNLVFAYADGEDVIYVNKNIGAQAIEYVKHYARQVRQKYGQIEIQMVDNFPTAERAPRGGGRRVDSLDSLMAVALTKNIDVDF